MVGRFGVPVNAVTSFARHCSKQQWKNFSSQSSSHPPVSSAKNSFAQPSLTDPLPGLPTLKFATHKEEHETSKITTLPNGLRVASENRFGQFCTVGVAIVSGSRFEVAYPSGISHFLEKLAFNSTTEFCNRDKILHSLEKHGGICDSQSSRDTMVYAASADSRGLDAVVKILGEVVLRPQISPEEVETARQAIQFELEALMAKPEQELILMDMIHAAAYRDNTLGFPKICPKNFLWQIDRSVLMTYLKHHHTPERMVIAGVGVNHDALVESVNRYFVSEKPIWETESKIILPSDKLKVDNSVAQYTGGIIQEVCDIPLHAGPSGLPELAHVVVGLESCSHQDPDFVPTCVLNMMMGGGGSFSAGGPGKGMYSRLYINVLNRYHWMFSAVAYNHSYIDTGLFCIHASATPTHVRDIVEVLVKEIVNMASSITPTELRRAKTQLQSMLLMNLEARPVVFEDIARQVLATGYRKKKEEFIESIENVTVNDIERVTQRLLRSQPSVAARGDIQKMPSLQEIQQGLLDKDGSMQRRSRLLR